MYNVVLISPILLFFSDILRLKNVDHSQLFDVSEVKQKLHAFCEQNRAYTGHHHSKQWEMYSNSKHDDLPRIHFPDCEEFEGSIN